MMISIRNKIFSGYLVILVLMVANGYLSFIKLSQITDHVDYLSNNLSARLIESRNIDQHTALVRGYAGAYSFSQSPADQNAFTFHMRQLIKSISSLESNPIAPEGKEQINSIRDTADRYEKAFNRLVALIEKRQEIIFGIMNESKFTIENKLNAIKIELLSQNESMWFFAFFNANDAFRQMLLYTSEYVRHGDERFNVLYWKAFNNAEASLDTLENKTIGTGYREKLITTRTSLLSYHEGFTQIRAGFQEQKKLLKIMFDTLEPVITEAVTGVVKEIEQQYEAHNRRSKRILTAARTRLLFFMAAALILGSGIGLFLAQKITDPMKGVMETSKRIAGEDLNLLTRQLKSLSNGDIRLEFNVKSKPLKVQSRDETGETARAFNEIIYQLLEAENAFSQMAAYLKRMTNTSLAVANGDLTVRVEKQSDHDMLGGAFSLMAENLEIARKEILQHQDQLEDLVQKRTEELVESRRLLATLMSNLPGMAYRRMNDEHRTMHFVSEGSSELTGYPPRSLVYNAEISYGRIIHPDDQTMVWDKVQEGLSRSLPFVCIYRIVTRQGEIKWVWEKGRGVFSECNELIAVEGFISDISEQKKAEQSLRDSEERFKALHNASFGGIGIHDNGVILECNQGLSDMTGYTTEELIGMDGLVLISEKSRSLVMSNIVSGYEKAYEAMGLRKTGEEFPLRIEARNIPYKGKTVRTVEFRDMTETKRAEEKQEKLQAQLAHSQKMESLGGIAAGMAHEINNPLAGMIQNASVIKSRLGDSDIPANRTVAGELGISMEDIKSFMEQRGIFRMIDAIHEAGSRAAEIVSSMLYFARKTETDISSYHPDQLVDKTLELAAADYNLKKKFDFKSIAIIKKYDDNLPLLACEGAQIQQVLLNILRNGAQAMQEAAVDSPKFIIRIYGQNDLKTICIEIEDNGPGMDEETRSKVFDPFFTTKPVGAGAGLGLSVSYFIITESHKGTMEVISEPGKGANFILRLPVLKS